MSANRAYSLSPSGPKKISHSRRLRNLRHKISSLFYGFVRPLFSSTSGPSSRVNGLSKGSEIRRRVQGQMTIERLPDDVLIDIFDFYANGYLVLDVFDVNDENGMARWRMLVQVCQRWRRLVFASPRRLGLVLKYNGKRPMREMLDIWPVLPIEIRVRALGRPWGKPHARNIVEGLKSEGCCDRVREIHLDQFPSSHWDGFVAAMQRPFPRLTKLRVRRFGMDSAVLPISDSFLGGSASHLQQLGLRNMVLPFPAAQRLLLTAENLVKLYLWNTPDAGYFSPEAIATCLSAMPRLRHLILQFDSPRRRPTERPPPLTRSVIPVLTYLDFEGAHEYLDDLLARIDAPLLRVLQICSFKDLMFDVPHLHRFISNAELLRTLNHLDVSFSSYSVFLQLVGFAGMAPLMLTIPCTQSDRQLSSLARVCRSPHPPFSTLEHLRIIDDRRSPPQWGDDTENIHWLDFLHPFAALKNLFINEVVAPRIGHALQDLARERTTKLLPALKNIYVSQFGPSDPVQEAIGQFVAERQRSGHPVVVHRWDGNLT
ncbi:hypothetical protein F5148DRAFT_1260102 [Russula earlei]|uniref:Uncharacterized protein n=1 Tax=Russula earlei TaxID=71964 RepID=A0ACC0TT44_9AGAM|nr:hypothetical protein F5148DRAFT_1260102 [Russula earlei]